MGGNLVAQTEAEDSGDRLAEEVGIPRLRLTSADLQGSPVG